MKSPNYAVIFILLVCALSVSVMVPLNIVNLGSRDKAVLNLYFESNEAIAPVEVVGSGTMGLYEYRSDSGWFNGLRGVINHYRTMSGVVTLNVGAFSESTTGKCEVVRVRNDPSNEAYKWTVTATFNVPASKVVSYITLDLDENGNEIPNQGTLPFSCSYNAEISGITSSKHGSKSGIAHVKIVGDVTDYIDPNPPPQDNEDMDFDDSQTVDDDGGSALIFYKGEGWSTQQTFIGSISIVIIVSLVATYIFLRWRRLV